MLLRSDPFREFDRMASQFFGDGRLAGAMPMDAYRQEDALRVDIDLPGVDPDSIELTIENDELTVTARRDLQEAERLLVRERQHGIFTRRIFLGDALDSDHLEANYQDGVLRLRIPVAESAKRRTVPISIGSEAHAIKGEQGAIGTGDAA